MLHSIHGPLWVGCCRSLTLTRRLLLASPPTTLHRQVKTFHETLTRRLVHTLKCKRHRQTLQAQYVALPVADHPDDGLGPTLDWMLEHLDEEIGVDDMAAHALMSARTFARRFREETGTTVELHTRIPA